MDITEESTASAILKDELALFAGRFHELGVFEGVVLVQVHGEVIYEGSWGLADRGSSKPNVTDGIFPIGSLTKQFVATAVLQRCANGDLDLHTPVGAYLPDIRKDLGQSITLHHLLTHGSGLPMHIRELSHRSDLEVHTPAGHLSAINGATLAFEPGTDYRYSNVGCVLCGLILERTADAPLRDILSQNIFRPAAMTHTALNTPSTVAVGSRLLATGEVLKADLLHHTYAYASGGVSTTANDLAAWDRALTAQRVLSGPWLRRMWTPNGTASGHYGYGWRIIKYERPGGSQGTLIRHGGSLPGYACNMHRYIEDGVTVVVLSNLNDTPVMQLTEGLAKIVFGLDAQPPLRIRSFVFWDILVNNGVDAAGAYAAAEREQGFRYGDLHRMGHQLRRLDRHDDGVAVFQAARLAFPEETSATHESIARIYRDAGKTQRAIDAFSEAIRTAGLRGAPRSEDWLNELLEAQHDKASPGPENDEQMGRLDSGGQVTGLSRVSNRSRCSPPVCVGLEVAR